MKTKHNKFYSKLHLNQLSDDDYAYFFLTMTDFDRDVINTLGKVGNPELFIRFMNYERKEKIKKLNYESNK